MRLSEIKEPNDLKKMKPDELDGLCREIRNYLIETVSKTGGHLSSNLGVVELTVALHYVFNMPTDKLFFDVGHQSYTHKLLTGRYDSFPTLRSFNGIAGFQKRAESEYDVWEAGHSSTSLSAAYAMAVARDLNKQSYHIVPVIGDGAIQSGEAFEALNQIGANKHNCIIILNDNNMSISKPVGAVSKMFENIRTNATYVNTKLSVKEFLKQNSVGVKVLNTLTSFKESFKDTVMDRSIFGELGLDYYGPVDGHNISELINILELAKRHDGPVVVHVMTTKGKGYPFCEDDKTGYWHGVGAFDPTTGASLSSLPKSHLSWSQIISETVTSLAKTNEDICVISPAMVTGGKLEKFFALYPERSFDCGISEEHATTFAAGLALSGKRPFLSIYSTFMQRAYDQINHDICRMDLPVVIGIDRAQLAGEDGETHHGVFDIGLLKAIPNMILAQPKDALEGQHLVYTAFHQNHPFGIRYPKGSCEYKEITDYQEIEIGSWEIFHENSDTEAYVITYGQEVDRLIQKFTINDWNIAVVNARFIKPMDENVLMHVLSSQKLVFTYELDMLENGLGASILEFANQKRLDTRQITRFGISDRYVPHGSLNALKKDLGLDINTICEQVKRIIHETR